MAPCCQDKYPVEFRSYPRLFNLQKRLNIISLPYLQSRHTYFFTLLFIIRRNIKFLINIQNDIQEFVVNEKNLPKSCILLIQQLTEEVYTELSELQGEIGTIFYDCFKNDARRSLLNLSNIGDESSKRYATFLLDHYKLRPCECTPANRSLICHSLMKLKENYYRQSKDSEEEEAYIKKRQELQNFLPKHLFNLIKWH